jgi:multicomponent Na+:H+ antiporter subunit D
LSVIGIPPFGGFISKWYLALGSIDSHHIPILVVLLTSSLLNAAYFLPIAYNAFFSSNAQFNETTTIQEAPFFAVAPPVFTAFVSFLLFVFPGFFLELARMTAKLVLS